MTSTRKSTNAQEATMYTYPLPIGTVLDAGTVTGLTYTAYRVSSPEGEVFVPFSAVHPLVAASPLVTL